jgi:hypothetical protein
MIINNTFLAQNFNVTTELRLKLAQIINVVKLQQTAQAHTSVKQILMSAVLGK